MRPPLTIRFWHWPLDRLVDARDAQGQAVMDTGGYEGVLIFQARAIGLPVPTTEHRFAPPRRWRFDLAWPEQMVACEVEGGSWVGGRHTRPQGFERDLEKYNEAALHDWLVLRVTGAMVNDGRAITYIERALQSRP